MKKANSRIVNNLLTEKRERGEIIKLIQRRKNRKIKKESGKMNGSVIKWNGLVSLGNNVLHDCPRIN